MNKLYLLLLPILGLLSSCINEDLSDCGVNYGLEYEVTLTTNVQTEVSTELTTDVETEVGGRLLSALSGFFAEYANDVNLNFYDWAPPQALNHSEDHYIGGTSASYTIYLPAKDYRHLSVANIAGEPLVEMPATAHADDYRMIQAPGDTIDSHTYGLFSARKDMQVMGDRDQVFHVNLYMQNCAAALVIDPNGVEYTDIKVYMTDLATGFSVNDSTYVYGRAPIIRTQALDTDGVPLLCYYGTGFPSRELGTAGAPELRAAAQSGLWRIKVYVTLPEGSTTETILYLPDALRAGQLRIIKAVLVPNGEVKPNNPEIGTGVDLDWKQGGNYETDL